MGKNLSCLHNLVLDWDNIKIAEDGLHFYFLFFSFLFFYFHLLFLEQLGLGLIGHVITSVT